MGVDKANSDIPATEDELRKQYSRLAQAASRGDQDEAVTEGLVAILEKTTVPELACKCAMTLSTVYPAAEYWDKCIFWARVALDQAESIDKNSILTFVAAKGLAIAWKDKLNFGGIHELDEFERFIEFVTKFTPASRMGNGGQEGSRRVGTMDEGPHPPSR